MLLFHKAKDHFLVSGYDAQLSAEGHIVNYSSKVLSVSWRSGFSVSLCICQLSPTCALAFGCSTKWQVWETWVGAAAKKSSPAQASQCISEDSWDRCKACWVRGNIQSETKLLKQDKCLSSARHIHCDLIYPYLWGKNLFYHKIIAYSPATGKIIYLLFSSTLSILSNFFFPLDQKDWWNLQKRNENQESSL